MRHGIAGNKLNRNSSHRKATVRDIAKATLIQERICTTKAKAKEARKLVDKLITLGKKGSLANKRNAFAILCNHKLVSDLFKKIAPRFKSRVGGYTRIIPFKNRRGDNAELVFLELTEKSKIILSKVHSTIVSTKEEDVKTIDVTESSEVTKNIDSSKKEFKSASKKEFIKSDKSKDGKKMFGGVRKMFNRKAGEK